MSVIVIDFLLILFGGRSVKLRIFSLTVIFALLLTACGSKGVKDAYNWQIDDFTHTDQNKEPFGLENLKGKVWVADFIFTNCDAKGYAVDIGLHLI